MVDFKDLLKAGVHFGHKASFGNPKMFPYIWGSKNKIHLIDISKTAFLLDHTAKKLKDIASNGGQILWIGTKKPAQEIIRKTAEDLKMPYAINRWLGGSLSNHGQIKKAITKYLHLKDIVKKTDTYYTKKEKVMLQKEAERLEKNIGGIVNLDFPPAAIVVVDAKKEHSAVKEARLVGIPVIALVDTNTDPSMVDYVVPGNDDSPKSIKFIIEYLHKFAAEGKKLAKAKKAEEEEKAAKLKAEKKTSAYAKATSDKSTKKAEARKAEPEKPKVESKSKIEKPKAESKTEAPKTAKKPVAVKTSTTTKKAVVSSPSAKATGDKKK